MEVPDRLLALHLYSTTKAPKAARKKFVVDAKRAWKDMVEPLGVTGPPTKQGGFAAVWLTKDKAIRCELITIPFSMFMSNLAIFDKVQKKMYAAGLGPKVFKVLTRNGADIHTTKTFHNRHMLCTVMERLPIVSWSTWGTYMNNDPKVLACNILTAGQRLLDIGIVHNDINRNNIALTSKGEIKFIDHMDLCYFAPDGKATKLDRLCNRSSDGYTPGYADPRIYGNRAGSDLRKMYAAIHTAITGEKISHKFKSQDFWNKTVLEKNFIYSLGMMIYSALFGEIFDNDNKPAVPPSKTRSNVESLPAGVRQAITTALLKHKIDTSCVCAKGAAAAAACATPAAKSKPAAKPKAVAKRRSSTKSKPAAKLAKRQSAAKPTKRRSAAKLTKSKPAAKPTKRKSTAKPTRRKSAAKPKPAAKAAAEAAAEAAAKPSAKAAAKPSAKAAAKPSAKRKSSAAAAGSAGATPGPGCGGGAVLQAKKPKRKSKMAMYRAKKRAFKNATGRRKK